MVPFQVTEFEARERCAVVTFRANGTEYREAVCVVCGKKMTSRHYWTNKRSEVERTAVGKWLLRVPEHSVDRKALAEMLRFVKSDVDRQPLH